MSSNCVVPGCDNMNKVRTNVMFHGFPRGNSRLCKLWLTAMGYPPTNKLLMAKVCSDHFLKCDYKHPRRSKAIKLKQTAIPSIFPQTQIPLIEMNVVDQQPSEESEEMTRLSDVAGSENGGLGTEVCASSAEGEQTPSEHTPGSSACNATTPKVVTTRNTLHPSRIHEDYCRSGSIQWAEDAWKNIPAPKIQTSHVGQQPSEINEGMTRLSDVAGKENGRPGTEGSYSAVGEHPSAGNEPAPTIVVDHSAFHPSRAHEHYCQSGSVQWAEGAWKDVSGENSKKGSFPPIQMSLRWQWLGMDMKGPLPRTHDGHTLALTVVDFYSKWVEAYPMRSLSPAEVALRIHCLICQLGCPHRILSRLDKTFIREVNLALKTYLDVEACSLVVFHSETYALDLLTQSYIDSMLSELVKDHQRSWDVQLPASLFSLRCREHPGTHHSPFYMLYSREPCTELPSAREQPLVEDELVHEEDTPPPPDTAPGPDSQLSSAQTAEPVPVIDLVDVEEVLVVQCERCSRWDGVPRASQREGDDAYTCAACRGVTRRGREPQSRLAPAVK
ncbi:uncharacterized protein LOC118218826 isoform X1 [Anguilla anguilla]|uniref:uncharacterized protein LOC118218826 isoform X1 n=1 Tax=Anguilla anguilla TaxID=7936 RepID=UPI0015AD38D6|nr:uncharacterized protein LOC118218826 isoform X1 [Anguilla anguilla]